MSRRVRASSRSLVWTALVFLAAAPAAAQTVIDPTLQVEVVATGLAQPTTMAFIGDQDILVLQKANGQVRRIIGGVIQAVPVLDVGVDSTSERGLLGIALDPDFAVNRRVFLYYTESATGTDTVGSPPPLGNRVYRYTWDGTALVNPVLILDLPVLPGPNHNAGVLTFGPDGSLYAIIGDLNHGGKLQNNVFGADPDDTGVMFRVDTDGAAPTDNPFFNRSNPSDPMNRYFAYGIRNSFGLTIDPATGALWDTENGPSFYDEVNRVDRGFNSGWTMIMGPVSRDPEGTSDLWVVPGSVYSDPEFSWQTPVAPTALAFAASPILGCGNLRDLFVGDNNCGQIYRFEPNAARDGLSFTSAALQDRVADNGAGTCSAEMAEIIFGSGFSVITDMENGPDGKLYIVSLGRGSIYRIGPKPNAVPDADGDTVADACDCAPSDSGAFALPAEVPRLRVTGAPATTLNWDPQSATAGSGTTYTIVTGDAGALRREGGFGSACTLRRGLPATTFVEARPDPPAGSASYYLVRAENTCGAGTFGHGSGVPDPEGALDVTLPPLCLGSEPSGGAMINFRVSGESLTYRPYSLNTVGSYCPWSAGVTAVDDRR